MEQQGATFDLTLVREDLSPPRFERYERAAGDLTTAMDLYLWNTDLSAAFYAVLQGVEVILRNAMSRELTAYHRSRGYPGTWFDDPYNLLGDRLRDDIARAKLRLQRDQYPVTQDRLITVVSFGFWRFLLSARYEHSLWIPALRKAFPHSPNGRRKYIADRVEHLHHLRNRIAHHEPVFPRQLNRDMEEAIEVVAAIRTSSATWLELYSWAPGLLATGIPTQSRSSN